MSFSRHELGLDLRRFTVFKILYKKHRECIHWDQKLNLRDYIKQVIFRF